MNTCRQTLRGRGAATNPANRFESIRLAPDPDAPPEDPVHPQTQFFRDATRGVIAYNESPDIGFNASVNPYRGCEHGCVYCYARPSHEYLGFSPGLEFESRIMVKEAAPQLLRQELAAPRWKPQVIAMSGVTDCYQPVERRLRLTRGCLEVLAECRNPVGIVTKSSLIERDLDVLCELAAHEAVSVCVSVTTLDPDLAARMEPRAPSPRQRLTTIERLAQAGIPVGVMTAPIIPALTDHELPALLQSAAAAGARFAGYVLLRLPYGLPALFEDWIRRHYPNRLEKILNRVRSCRSGALNQPHFGTRMAGEGPFAEQISRMFEVSCRKAGIRNEWRPILSTAAFRRPRSAQLELFDPT